MTVSSTTILQLTTFADSDAVDLTTHLSTGVSAKLESLFDGSVSPAGSLTTAWGTITTARGRSYTATWNAAGVTFVGWDLSVTRTAAAAASRLFRVQQGGNVMFSIASVASAGTGLLLTPAAAASGFDMSVVTTGTDENLTVNAAGAGTITLGNTSTGAITLTRATTLSAAATFSAASPIVMSNATATVAASAATATLTLLSQRTNANAGTAFVVQTYSAADAAQNRITVDGGSNQGSGKILLADPINISATSSTNNQLWNASQGAGSNTMYIGNASVTTSSDVRLKANVRPSGTDWGAVLDKVRVVDYSWSDPSDRNNPWGRHSRGRWTGLVAQEVVQIPELRYLVNAPDINCPDCKNGRICIIHDGYWGFDGVHLVGPLVAAVQQLRQRLAAAGIA